MSLWLIDDENGWRIGRSGLRPGVPEGFGHDEPPPILVVDDPAALIDHNPDCLAESACR